MNEQLKAITEKACENPPAKISDLKGLFLYCTLTPTPLLYHAAGLIKKDQMIF